MKMTHDWYPQKTDSSKMLQEHSDWYLKETNPYDTMKSFSIGGVCRPV